MLTDKSILFLERRDVTKGLSDFSEKRVNAAPFWLLRAIYNTDLNLKHNEMNIDCGIHDLISVMKNLIKFWKPESWRGSKFI